MLGWRRAKARRALSTMLQGGMVAALPQRLPTHALPPYATRPGGQPRQQQAAWPRGLPAAAAPGAASTSPHQWSSWLQAASAWRAAAVALLHLAAEVGLLQVAAWTEARRARPAAQAPAALLCAVRAPAAGPLLLSLSH